MQRHLFATFLVTQLLGALHPALSEVLEPVVAPPEQVQQYTAEVPKTVVELQQFRRTRELTVSGPDGRRGTATLIDLNPQFGVWYLLTLDWGDSNKRFYHLENATPGAQTVTLDPGFDSGVMLHAGAAAYPCALWSGPVLEQAAARPVPYAPLCDGRLYLHNAVRGRRSDLEAVVEFLRGHVWGGEEIVNLAKETVFRNAGREQAKLGGNAPLVGPGTGWLPRAARLAPAYADREIGRGDLGIRLAAPAGSLLPLGRWTPARDVDGVYLSLVAPEAIAPEILDGHRGRVNALDAKESSALVYLIAFDLDRFALGFGLGTDNPQVDWSERVPDAVRLESLPGPDGIGTISPLIATGMIPPDQTARTVASFAGGFKRYHGAFRYGDLARQNHGSHYGFIQEGVVLSKLQPGLSTLYVLRDGTVHMHVWRDEDNRELAQVRYARQNGVPLVEWDASAAEPVPGALVNRWGAGNWSGSEEESLRTVRAGACLQQSAASRYLIYAYFSNATPSAMARVFQAYGCHHAMQMDINAPILTYLAIYPGGGVDPAVQYLVQAMGEADQQTQGQPVPRFLGLPDNRDFFYLMRREGGAS
jgi:hypothetical protein